MKTKLKTIKIREQDYKRIKKWAEVRGMKIYSIIKELVNK